MKRKRRKTIVVEGKIIKKRNNTMNGMHRIKKGMDAYVQTWLPSTGL